MLSMKHLRMMAIFAKVAETGSFKQAAEQLDMVPSVVSKQVRDLENELGLQLIFRSTRSIRLSEVGKTFLVSCNRMLKEAETGFNRVTQQSSALKGSLNITLPTVFICEGFSQFIMQFKQQYPDIQLGLDFNDATRDLIRDNFDMALHIGELEDSQLFAKRIISTQGWVCASSQFNAEMTQLTTPLDLQTIKGVLIPGFVKGIDFTPALTMQPRQTIKPLDYISATNGAFIRMSLNHQPSWAIFPDFVIQEDINSGRLIRLLPDWIVSSTALYAVTPSQLTRLPLAEVFVSEIMAFFNPSS